MPEDKVMRNARLAQIFKNRPDLYPYELQKEFPRVIDRIAELWGNSELLDYFDKLMIDYRGGRKGFPKEAMTDLWLLDRVHTGLYPHLSRCSHHNGVWRWANGNPIDPLSLEK